MEPRHISAVNQHPIDLRAAQPNVLEHVVIERMKLAYRRDACASDGVGVPPFAGRGDDRLGQYADDGRHRLRFKIRISIADVQGHRSFPQWPQPQTKKWVSRLIAPTSNSAHSDRK